MLIIVHIERLGQSLQPIWFDAFLFVCVCFSCWLLTKTGFNGRIFWAIVDDISAFFRLFFFELRGILKFQLMHIIVSGYTCRTDDKNSKNENEDKRREGESERTLSNQLDKFLAHQI